MDHGRLAFVRDELLRIREAMLARRTEIPACSPHLRSCLNMQDFLSLKKHDLVLLQQELVDLGLSSLEHSHYYLLYTIDRQLMLLSALLGTAFEPVEHERTPTEVYASMERRSAFLRSDANKRHSVMVTLPSDAARDGGFIRSLALQGVDVCRINTAHDTPEVWEAMATKIREVNREIRQHNPMRIYVDLAGPKIRTGRIDETADPIRLFTGDTLLLRFDDVTAKAARKEHPTQIACTSAAIFEHVAVGDKIFIDDGKLALRAAQITEKGIVCEVVGARPKGVVLKAEKGINFPDTELEIPAVTEKDRAHLAVVAPFADIIGVSFAQCAGDIRDVKTQLRTLGREQCGIVAKIETRTAVRQLPFILMELFSWQHSGVMIARGDLAIEVGFENLALIQEELFELCEAAHTPVIYATQILESMMKAGIPSRAEVVDAAASRRADCVMLNKGAFTLQTVQTLQKILQSVEPHYFKNRHLLPVVMEWRGFHDTMLKFYHDEGGQ